MEARKTKLNNFQSRNEL